MSKLVRWVTDGLTRVYPVSQDEISSRCSGQDVDREGSQREHQGQHPDVSQGAGPLMRRARMEKQGAALDRKRLKCKEAKKVTQVKSNKCLASTAKT